MDFIELGKACVEGGSPHPRAARQFRAHTVQLDGQRLRSRLIQAEEKRPSIACTKAKIQIWSTLCWKISVC